MTTTQLTEPVRLSRTEADIVVRQLTGEYHNRHGVDLQEVQEPGSMEGDLVFRDFVARLAADIGGDNTRDFRDYLVDALRAFENLMDIYWGDQPHDRRDQYESDLNMAVNGALDAAGFPAGMILRYGPQVVALPVAA